MYILLKQFINSTDKLVLVEVDPERGNNTKQGFLCNKYIINM